MKQSKDNTKIQVLNLFLIASAFVGLSLNGGEKGWLSLNGISIHFIVGMGLPTYSFLSILVIIWTGILYLMPLFVVTTYRNKMVIGVPCIYLILTLYIFPSLIIFCMPFIACWIILMSTVLRIEGAKSR